MDQKKSFRINPKIIPIVDKMLANMVSWLVATSVLFALIAGLILVPIFITAYQVTKEPKNTALWGWIYMWTEFRNPDTFHPLVCDDSQAADLTEQYRDILPIIPFKFKNVEAEQIGENRVSGKAIVECTLLDSEDMLVHDWQAEFITEISPPVGLCIAEIHVTTGASLCQFSDSQPESIEDEILPPDAN